MISFVSPAFNEEENLQDFYQGLNQTLSNANVEWELILIDDHSTDRTWDAVSELAKKSSNVKGIRLAKNGGSHAAVLCGFHHASGDAVIVMAADLQDDPSVALKMLESWKNGNQIVWAVRNKRTGEKVSTRLLSRVFGFFMRRIHALRNLPAQGADYFLVDRIVVDWLKMFKEGNVNILALISSLGFNQSEVFYDKVARKRGKSGWTIERKVKVILDSITSFTYFPIRLMSYIGFIVSFLGMIYAGVVIFNAFTADQAPPGWASLMVAVLFVGGFQMIMMGILGEYVWRALDEARGRPRYIVERTTKD